MDEYYIFSSQEVPVTYISTMEVNSYFQNKGIYKKMCKEVINFINKDQHILTTNESEIGSKYNVFIILKNALITNGFFNCIFKDNDIMYNKEIFDIICYKKKVLKK